MLDDISPSAGKYRSCLHFHGVMGTCLINWALPSGIERSTRDWILATTNASKYNHNFIHTYFWTCIGLCDLVCMVFACRIFIYYVQIHAHGIHIDMLATQVMYS